MHQGTVGCKADVAGRTPIAIRKRHILVVQRVVGIDVQAIWHQTAGDLLPQDAADRIQVERIGQLVAEGTAADLKRIAGAATLDDAFIALTGEDLANEELVEVGG